MKSSPTGIVAPASSRSRLRTDSTPWFRQFWPWFLIALPLTSVVFSFVTLYIAVSGADEVLPHEGDSTSYSAPVGPAPVVVPAPDGAKAANLFTGETSCGASESSCGIGETTRCSGEASRYIGETSRYIGESSRYETSR